MAGHFEIMVEEPSMEAFLREILAGSLAPDATFEIYPYQGKDDLLARLEERLRGYAAWLPDDWRILVVIDRDDDDCRVLKKMMEDAATASGLTTRSSAPGRWRVVTRIAIEELEAWYFGDWEAVRACYPRVSANVPRRSRYRDCDGIAGGTWEAFERELQSAGYFAGGLRKIDAARAIGARFSAQRCASGSFRHVLAALQEAPVSRESGGVLASDGTVASDGAASPA